MNANYNVFKVFGFYKVLPFLTLQTVVKQTFKVFPINQIIVSIIRQLMPEMLLNSMNGLKLSTKALTPEMTPIKGSRLTETLTLIFESHKQSPDTYESKMNLRLKIYSLLSKRMTEKIDLYLIGSSLNGFGCDSSDTDLCLIIYDSDNKIDAKYEDKNTVIEKLKELKQMLATNETSIESKVIPALVPILTFFDKSTECEVNLNLNRTVTIRNTHLLNMYSQIDDRVSPLIVSIKVWARKNGINSAFNKSLNSFSISLMAIYYLQSVCKPPVLPCLQKLRPDLFDTEITRLRLNRRSEIGFKSTNSQDLGQLFTGFLEYFTFKFTYDKVISVRTGTLTERNQLLSKHNNGWQWKCHICIEEPFDRTNTSHAVHQCSMFRQIYNSFIDTYNSIINNSFTLDRLS